MSPEVQQKIMEYVDAIAQNLGVASETVWAMLVRQAMVKGIVYTIMDIAVPALVTFIIYKIWRATIKHWDAIYSRDLEIPLGFAIAIATLFGAVFVIASVMELPEKIMMIFNPGYYALKEIFDAVKK